MVCSLIPGLAIVLDPSGSQSGIMPKRKASAYGFDDFEVALLEIFRVGEHVMA